MTRYMASPTIIVFCLTLSLPACSPASQEGATAPHSPESRQADIPSEMVVDTPSPGAEVASPITLSGQVPGTWYFEGSFPYRLVGADGEALAEGVAESRGNWMTEAPVHFETSIDFTVEQPTEATLVLSEDDPSGQKDVDEARIPLVLMPGA